MSVRNLYCLSNHLFSSLSCDLWMLSQLWLGVLSPVTMSMNWARCASTGEKRTRGVLNTLSTLRLFLWRSVSFHQFCPYRAFALVGPLSHSHFLMSKTSLFHTSHIDSTYLYLGTHLNRSLHKQCIKNCKQHIENCLICMLTNVQGTVQGRKPFLATKSNYKLWSHFMSKTTILLAPMKDLSSSDLYSLSQTPALELVVFCTQGER